MVSSRLFHSLAAAFVLLSASCTRQLPEAQIPIMAWYCIPAADATPERYRELADCGFTINFSHLRTLEELQQSLDCAREAGVKAMATCRELESRPDSVVNMIKEHPGLVRDAAPDGSTRNYEWWIVRRDSQTVDKGEGLGIVYDANKFTLSDQHYFWLTEKDPDVMNYGWDETSYRRMACCAVVTETATGKQFFMMVTHMPLAATARQGAAALINAREAMYSTGKLPAFLVGDMNATPDDPATATFQSGKWNDSYEKVPVASRVGQVITFHSQKAITDMTSAENRIDYVY